MNTNSDNKHTSEIQNESKSDQEEEEEPVYMQQINKISNKDIDIEGADKEEDSDDDEENSSLHTVSSVKEIKRPTQIVTIEGTHTTDTATESNESLEVATAKLQKQICFEQIIEELTIPTPSNSRIVENVREYVKQIVSEHLDESDEFSLPRCQILSTSSEVQLVASPKEAIHFETIKGVSDLSFTTKQSDERLAILSEVESIAHNEVERIVDGNITTVAKKLPDFQQVERDNHEIAERFKQIMEMFDNFTKNLESLEMPALKTAGEQVTEKSVLPLRRRLSFKDLRSADLNVVETRCAMDKTSGDDFYNEDYLEMLGDRKTEVNISTIKETTTTKSLTTKSFDDALDPKCRDIATTISGLELQSDVTSSKASRYADKIRDSQVLNPIGCQTSVEFLTMQRSTLSSTSSALKSFIQPNNDDSSVNALIIDSVTDQPTTSSCALTIADATENSNITIMQPCTRVYGTTDQSSLVKICEPPTIIDLNEDTKAAPPLVTSVVVEDAPCERTYHTIHIEANSSPTSSEMRRAPLCSRLWNVITDFCAAVCLCLQVNKDCLFCLGFFIAFVVSASFLTAFFYRTLSINPQLLHASLRPSNSNINPIHDTYIEHPLYDM